MPLRTQPLVAPLGKHPQQSIDIIQIDVELSFRLAPITLLLFSCHLSTLGTVLAERSFNLQVRGSAGRPGRVSVWFTSPSTEH